MKVFISQSGPISKEIAKILSDWLPHVLQAVKPYYAPDDLRIGARWFGEISRELEESEFGILCMTADNLSAPWIMFEAGALSKRLTTSKVCPLVFEVKTTDLEGPLAEFQGATFDKDGIMKTLETINAELGEVALAQDKLEASFEKWWPDFEEKLNTLLNSSPQQEREQRSETDMIEEVLAIVRTMGRTDEPARINLPAINHLVYLYNRLVTLWNPEKPSPLFAPILMKMRDPLELIARGYAYPHRVKIEALEPIAGIEQADSGKTAED